MGEDLGKVGGYCVEEALELEDFQALFLVYLLLFALFLGVFRRACEV